MERPFRDALHLITYVTMKLMLLSGETIRVQKEGHDGPKGDLEG